MKAVRSLLCDYVQMVENGKVNLIGVFDQFNMKEVPGDLPPFYVYTALQGDGAEEFKPGTRRLRITAVDEADEVVIDAEQMIVEERPVEGMAVVIQFGRVPVNRTGRLLFKIYCDENLVDSIRAKVGKKEG